VFDANRDGYADVVISHADRTAVSILMNNGKGGLAVQQSFDVGRPAFEVVDADLDRDGNRDLVATTVARRTPADSAIVTLLGNGRGGFRLNGEPIPTDAGAYFVAAGDINEDGQLDVLASGSKVMTLLRGR
jgi:hypothetical protein